MTAADHAPALRRLELFVTRRLDGLLRGVHQGLLPGQGSESGESRDYAPGDDVRLMDWNVTARTGVPHVRMPVAEHELITWALVDLSPSVWFGTAAYTKLDLTAAALGSFGFLTTQHGNRLGAVLMHGRDTAVVRPARNRAHLRALLERIASSPEHAGGPADLASGLEVVSRLAQRRGLVVVVSDFLCPSTWERPLRTLATRHDVFAIEVVDPRELTLPDVGVITLMDAETGAVRDVQTSSVRLRRRYEDAASAQREAIKGAIAAAGAEHLVLRTDRDWLLDVVAFVNRRRTPRGVRLSHSSGR